ncbi:MAG: type II secretion system protein [Motilibacteraceae bacterium]
MLARIRKAMDEKEQGFTLIELLVVMIIIGILAAIAIPVFLNQRKKAQDTAAKADVSTIGKEVATYYVDNTTAPTLALTTGGRYTLTAGTTGATAQDIGAASANVTLKSQHFTDATHWCVAVQNTQGSVQLFKYTAQAGLVNGADCVATTDY